MKRNWVVQGASFAVAAALLAGCQTGQKSSTLSFNDKYPSYGDDLGEAGFDDAGRSPASLVAPMKEFLRLISNADVLAKSGTKYTVETLQRDFKSYVNALKDPEVLKLKKTLNKQTLELDDLAKLDNVKVEAAIVKKFMAARTGSVKANSVLRSEADKLVTRAQKAVQFHETNLAADAALAGGVAGGLKKGAQKPTAKAPLRSGSVDQAAMFEIKDTKKARTINGEYEVLAVREDFQASDAQQILRDSKDKVGTYHAKTKAYAEKRLIAQGADPKSAKGRSVVSKEMCDNVDPAALKSHNEMMDDLIRTMDETDPKSGKKWGMCTNIAEIEAWVVAKYQANVLARPGMMAWVAVSEMGVCKYVKPDTASEAQRKVAGGQSGIAPPECK